MMPGIYALASLSGAPLAKDDLLTLSLGQENPDQAHQTGADGFAVRVQDPQTAALDIHQAPDAIFAFAGYLDEPHDLADLLSLPHDARPAALAAAALARFAKDAAAHMLGEWSLLRWHKRSRELTLLASQGLRDLMFFAISPDFVAVAPRVLLLADLPWVGRALDPAGFALGCSRAGLRHIKTTETIWKGIRQVQPGGTEIFGPVRQTQLATGPSVFERWEGSFEEAADALEAVGRRVIRQHMQRQGRCAFLLSGGLDSTLLNSWAAFERGPGREFFALSSVAPPGSGLADESIFIRQAAEALGIDSQTVWPDAEDNLFRPPAELFRQAEGIAGGPYLVHLKFEQAARQAGASAIVDGISGELHVSAGFDMPETRSWLRIRLAEVRDALKRRRESSGWPSEAFHFALNPSLLDQLPARWGAVWRKGPPRPAAIGKGDPPMGINFWARKPAVHPSAMDDTLRTLAPFRDQRLQRLAARLPVSFMRHGGLTRPLARRMLAGRVPDSVRLRVQGRPFSPDFVPRVKRQAATVQTRMGLFREAGVERWLDLEWLSDALIRVATARGESDYKEYYRVQGTTAAAEFLLWAASEGVRL